MVLNVSFMQELLNTVAEQGRALLPKGLFGLGNEESVEELARALISGRGEASGVAIARQLLMHYNELSGDEQGKFFRFLADTMGPAPAAIAAAAQDYLDQPTPAALSALQGCVESRRCELFRRLNLAPGATAGIVGMRKDLAAQADPDGTLKAVDADLRSLLQTWFNRGFLVLKRIDWQTPAAILEKIIAYEAVHEIKGWDDLRRRLDPVDRRCFAFFHPSLVDEPLIFVEVALVNAMPSSIAPLISSGRATAPDNSAPTTAVFYSISNCQEGLKGISFGNFLLKQVVEDLVRENPSLKTFVTLSPVPHFARWLDRAVAAANVTPGTVTDADRKNLALLNDPRWTRDETLHAELKSSLMALSAHYLMSAKSDDNRPVDPVARFHLGNGARLERINWLADTSEKGLREAHGLMVNYRYEIKDIEKNHEAYANDGTVAVSKAARAWLRATEVPKPVNAAKTMLALPGVTGRRSQAPG